MALGKSAAIVIGSFPLGESDRVVTFFAREHGKVRGIAKASRRIRSRFGGALELFTLGQLVFFDTGRSELVRVDHFDVTEPFARVREDLERLGQASWIVECVARLTAERDPHAGLYGLLGRSLRAIDAAAPPARVAACFAVRCLDALGHRPRLDRCVACGRTYPFARPALDEGGIVCEPCAAVVSGATPISPAAVAAMLTLRSARWEDALTEPLGRAGAELKAALETHMTRLIGQPTRTLKFLREVRRLSHVSGERA
jgi:DNA repair protein RecO (recombination protein O)